MDQWMHAHVYLVMVIFWLFSNFVATMPSPDGGWTGGVGYKWLFAFLHSLAGSIPRIAGVLAPNSAISKLIAPGSTNSEAPPADPGGK